MTDIALTSTPSRPFARIGPNAIWRMAEALDASIGRSETARLFRLAGLGAYMVEMPGHMVDEREVMALHKVVRAELGPQRAALISTEAGRLTGDYLLAHRIPRPVQALLKILPATIAARILIKAIGGHAWTFSGSGRFEARLGHPVVLTITDGPLARECKTDIAVCDYYTATFQRLFETLVHPRTRVTETDCQAKGDSACVFEIRWK